jgi:cellulose synthase (UDP-forming)
MSVVRISQDARGHDIVSCRLLADDWEGYRTMSLWLFHTPPRVIDGMPSGVPVVAASKGRRSPLAVRSFGQDAPVAPAR